MAAYVAFRQIRFAFKTGLCDAVAANSTPSAKAKKLGNNAGACLYKKNCAAYFCRVKTRFMNRIIQQFHGKIFFIPLLLLAVDALLSCYEYASGNVIKSRFIIFSLGLTAGWLSLVSGVVALLGIRKNELAAGLFFIHGFINSMALLVLSAFWTHENKAYPFLPVSKLPVAFMKWLLLFILLCGTYLGKKAAKKLAEP